VHVGCLIPISGRTTTRLPPQEDTAARRGSSERRGARRFCTRRRLGFVDAIAESLRTAVLLRRLKGQLSALTS
jgi:hypothetical protein